MKYTFIIIILLLCMGGCRSGEARVADPMPRQVYVKTGGVEDCKVCLHPAAEFTHVSDEFYTSQGNKLFVKTALLKEVCGKTDLADVFVEIPKIDIKRCRREGWYLIDSSKVVCVFENSDGGNYVELKGADAATFKVFKHVFGGRDKDHVFSMSEMVVGMDPKKVKVYSDLENCANCEGYFRQGKLLYHGSERVDGDVIPKEYKYVE